MIWIFNGHVCDGGREMKRKTCRWLASSRSTSHWIYLKMKETFYELHAPSQWHSSEQDLIQNSCEKHFINFYSNRWLLLWEMPRQTFSPSSLWKLPDFDFISSASWEMYRQQFIGIDQKKAHFTCFRGCERTIKCIRSNMQCCVGNTEYLLVIVASKLSFCIKDSRCSLEGIH